jgi:uncharacterized protein YihD (DUF1040 family)
MKSMLEKFVEILNQSIFLKEFTFARAQFVDSDNSSKEFADNVLWLEDEVVIFQLKERDPLKDKNLEHWFEKKVVKKATKQIRVTLNYFNKHQEISIVNGRNHKFNIEREIKKNPQSCTLFSTSRSSSCLYGEKISHKQKCWVYTYN